MAASAGSPAAVGVNPKSSADTAAAGAAVANRYGRSQGVMTELRRWSSADPQPAAECRRPLCPVEVQVRRDQARGHLQMDAVGHRQPKFDGGTEAAQNLGGGGGAATGH